MNACIANEKTHRGVDTTKIFWYEPSHQFLVGELPADEYAESIYFLAYGPLGHRHDGIVELPYRSVMDCQKRRARITEATPMQLHDLPRESDLAQLVQRMNRERLLARIGLSPRA